MEVLPELNDSKISPIRAARGLYVSSRLPASSLEHLSSEGITHVVRVLQDNELPRNAQGMQSSSLIFKQIPIDDDGDEDILIHLNDVYQWIEDALHESEPPLEGNSTSTSPRSQNRVLIHCRIGMSRSGTIAVAYLMKKLSLSYSAALNLARESRPIIMPNPGFERQLRIWEHCRYDIYLPAPATSPPPASSPGSEKTDKQLRTGQPRPTKAAYTVWKRERDGAAVAERSARRVEAMASAAAEFGRRRWAAQGSNEDGMVSNQNAGENEEALKRKRQWDRVKEMETAWNEKLIRGEVQRAKDEGNLETLMNEVFDSIKHEP